MDFFLHSFWMIALLPLLSAVGIATFARSLQRKAWWVGAGLMGVALLWAIMVLLGVANGGEHEAAGEAVNFLTTPAVHIVWQDWSIWGPFHISLGLQVDNLTSIMLVVVTLVSFCVQIYSPAISKPVRSGLPGSMRPSICSPWACWAWCWPTTCSCSWSPGRSWASALTS